jgi:proteic killer suppression protein
VDILFLKSKCRKKCSDSTALTRAYGPTQAKVLRRRMDDLRAAQNLEELRSAPGRLHQLTADLSSSFSLDLVHPSRLIFRCANSPVPTASDGKSIDWCGVTAVELVEVANTHE